MGFTNTLEAQILDHVMNDGAYTPPTNWFVGLSTTLPTGSGSNFTEPTIGSFAYARVSTSGATWSLAVQGDPSTKSNGVAITFPQATGSWGTVVAFGLFTASTGGTAQITGTLTTSHIVSNGDQVLFAIGELILQAGKSGDVF